MWETGGLRKQMKRNKIKMTVVALNVIGCVVLLGSGYRQKAVMAEVEHTVSINEVCHNFSTFAGEDGVYRDYIELYNEQEKEISLEGFYLSDSVAGINRYFLGDFTIDAGDTAMVFLSKKKDRISGAAYADFAVKDGGTTLYLFDQEENLIDWVSVPQLRYDTSYGRNADGQWQHETPTPGAANDAAERILPEKMEQPLFSVDSGFYEESFYLEIMSDQKGRIYYTLDGSEPTAQSFLYEAPILIEDASKNENKYAARTDLSAGFFAEEDRYAVPSEKVDKAVVVRAVVISNDGMEKSAVATRSYFVGFDEKGYDSFPVISLITDPAHLFDYEKGIYVAGQTFDQFVESGELARMRNPDNWMRWKGNYTNQGREWERPVHIDYFDAERNLVMEEEAGVRIKGGATRSYVQKSLKLYARDIYSGRDYFSEPFFGDTGACRVALFSGANDYKMKIRDVLIHNTCNELHFSTMKNIPCYVFLDGEYWGIYHLMEKFDEKYVEENYGVPADDVIMIKATHLNCGEEEDYGYYLDLMQMAEEKDFSDPEEYEKLCGLIDMQSFMDYYGTEIYAARCEDWPDMNEALWRSRSITEQSYQDGKWRWMIYDMNWGNGGLSESLADMDSFRYVREKSRLFDNLMNNVQFRQEFVLNFCDLTNTCLSEQALLTEFLRLREVMREPLVWDFKRFYGENRKESDYHKEADDLQNFLQKRYDYIIGYMKEDFGLEGALEELHITVENSEGGIISVNGSEVELVNGTWSGRYFTDYPVRITAVPKSGWQFAGWDGSAAPQSDEILVDIREGGVFLTAAFVE